MKSDNLPKEILDYVFYHYQKGNKNFINISNKTKELDNRQIKNAVTLLKIDGLVEYNINNSGIYYIKLTTIGLNYLQQYIEIN